MTKKKKIAKRFEDLSERELLDPTVDSKSYLSEFKADNPLSLINLVSDHLQKHILKIPEKLLNRDEGSLERTIKPTTLDYMLRYKFWILYDGAIQSNGKKRITGEKVSEGICSNYYWGKCVRRPEFLSWLIRPIPEYNTVLESMLIKCSSRWAELVDMDIHTVDGHGKRTKNVDPRKASVLLDVIQAIEKRVLGQTVERKIIKTQGETDMKKVFPAEYSDMHTVSERIKDLEGLVKADESHNFKTLSGKLKN